MNPTLIDWYLEFKYFKELIYSINDFKRSNRLSIYKDGDMVLYNWSLK